MYTELLRNPHDTNKSTVGLFLNECTARTLPIHLMNAHVQVMPHAVILAEVTMTNYIPKHYSRETEHD